MDRRLVILGGLTLAALACSEEHLQHKTPKEVLESFPLPVPATALPVGHPLPNVADFLVEQGAEETLAFYERELRRRGFSVEVVPLSPDAGGEITAVSPFARVHVHVGRRSQDGRGYFFGAPRPGEPLGVWMHYEDLSAPSQNVARKLIPLAAVLGGVVLACSAWMFFGRSAPKPSGRRFTARGTASHPPRPARATGSRGVAAGRSRTGRTRTAGYRHG